MAGWEACVFVVKLGGDGCGALATGVGMKGAAEMAPGTKTLDEVLNVVASGAGIPLGAPAGLNELAFGLND